MLSINFVTMCLKYERGSVNIYKNSEVFQMIVIRLLLLILLFLSSSFYSVRAQEFMGIDEIDPGMRGIGKTTFEGTEIEEFEFEVLSIIRNAWGPKKDIILVRLGGGPAEMPLEKTGVISGMSGSPLYIDGKLIGAIAYGFLFSKEPIAGVTPIKEMIAILEYPPDSRSASLSVSPHPMAMAPIHTPLMVSGFHPQVIKEMEPVLKKRGFLIGVGGGRKEGIAPELAPGAAVGIQLVRGDWDISGAGTVTYRRDNRILAFGHRVLWGEVTLPMTASFVHTVVPSQLFSFRLSSSMEPLGGITHDRRAGIAGEIGKRVEMVPVRIEVKSNGDRQKYNFEAIDDPFWTPQLLLWTGFNSVLVTEALLGEGTIELTLEIWLEGRKDPVIINNVFPDHNFMRLAPLAGFLAPVGELMQNEFEEVLIERISLEIEMVPKRRMATIESVRLSKDKAAPGEEVEITVFLRIHQTGKIVPKRLTLRIPHGVPDGNAIITVSDAISSMKLARAHSPSIFQPRNLEQMISLIEEEEPNTSLMIRALFPQQEFSIRGEALPGAPASFLSIISSPEEVGTVERIAFEIVLRENTDWVLSGSRTILLRIEED